MAERRQFVSGSLVARFGLVTQGEQGLVAARVRAGPCYGQNLVDTHISPLPRPRRLREGAIMAHVPAQLRQGNENLWRVGNDPSVALITQLCGTCH